MIFHTLETVRYYMAKAKTKKGLKVKVSILDKVYESSRRPLRLSECDYPVK